MNEGEGPSRAEGKDYCRGEEEKGNGKATGGVTAGTSVPVNAQTARSAYKAAEDFLVAAHNPH